MVRSSTVVSWTPPLPAGVRLTAQPLYLRRRFPCCPAIRLRTAFRLGAQPVLAFGPILSRPLLEHQWIGQPELFRQGDLGSPTRYRCTASSLNSNENTGRVGFAISVVPPRVRHRPYKRLMAPLPTPSRVATAQAPQPVSNNATAASRCSSDNVLLPCIELLPESQN